MRSVGCDFSSEKVIRRLQWGSRTVILYCSKRVENLWSTTAKPLPKMTETDNPTHQSNDALQYRAGARYPRIDQWRGQSAQSPQPHSAIIDDVWLPTNHSFIHHYQVIRRIPRKYISTVNRYSTNNSVACLQRGTCTESMREKHVSSARSSITISSTDSTDTGLWDIKIPHGIPDGIRVYAAGSATWACQVRMETADCSHKSAMKPCLNYH